jgi:hypothetical protein
MISLVFGAEPWRIERHAEIEGEKAALRAVEVIGAGCWGRRRRDCNMTIDGRIACQHTVCDKELDNGLGRVKRSYPNNSIVE